MDEEAKHHELSCVSFPWWSDSHNRPHQSPWLQAILSDLDEKIKTIVNLIEDRGDSFAERADMFYKRRPQLLNILKDLHLSYRSLAEKYDRLMASPSSSSSSSSSAPLFKLHPYGAKLDEYEDEPHISPTVTPSNIKEIDDVKMNVEVDQEEQAWGGLRETVSKLMEDNRRQQAELIRRNDEKRRVIKQLSAQISGLMEENRALRKCLASYDLKPNHSYSNSNINASKLKGLNCIGKFHY